MGRATDPGENHDPGKDQRFTPSLTQEPRLENGLGHRYAFGWPDARCLNAAETGDQAERQSVGWRLPDLSGNPG